MGSWRTHAVWGAALAHSVWVAAPAVVDLLVPLTHPALQGILWVGGSAIMALWPDIDEPSSKASTSTRALGGLAGAGIGTVIGLDHASLVAAVLMGTLGLLLGGWGTGMVLTVLRRLAGGHRRATHSLILVGCCCLLALAGYLVAHSWASWLTIGAGWLAWGVLIHLPPDLTTPQGVPLWYPFGSTTVRLVVIPEWLMMTGGVVWLLFFLGHLLPIGRWIP